MSGIEFEYGTKLAQKYRSRILTGEPHGFALGNVGTRWIVYIGPTDATANRQEHLKHMSFASAPPALTGLEDKTPGNLMHGKLQLQDGGLLLTECAPQRGTAAVVTRLNKAFKDLKMKRFRPHTSMPAALESEMLPGDSFQDPDHEIDDLRPDASVVVEDNHDRDLDPEAIVAGNLMQALYDHLTALGESPASMDPKRLERLFFSQKLSGPRVDLFDVVARHAERGDVKSLLHLAGDDKPIQAITEDILSDLRQRLAQQNIEFTEEFPGRLKNTIETSFLTHVDLERAERVYRALVHQHVEDLAADEQKAGRARRWFLAMAGVQLASTDVRPTADEPAPSRGAIARIRDALRDMRSTGLDGEFVWRFDQTLGTVLSPVAAIGSGGVGICAAVATEWIRHHANGSSLANVVGGDKAGRVRYRALREIGQLQGRSSRESRGDQEANLEEWLREHGVVPIHHAKTARFSTVENNDVFRGYGVPAATASEGSAPHVEDDLVTEMRKLHGCYARVNVGGTYLGGNVGHALAVWIGGQSEDAMMFDPNAGEIWFEKKEHFFEFFPNYFRGKYRSFPLELSKGWQVLPCGKRAPGSDTSDRPARSSPAQGR